MSILRWLLILLFFSTVNDIVAQNSIEFLGIYQDCPYKENNVREVKQYLIYPDNKNIQILQRHEYFNKYAYLKQRSIYAENGDEISRESYNYKNDTLLISSQYESFANDLVYNTELKYNKKGQLIKSITKNGKNALSKRKYKWNKKKAKLKMINDLGNSKIKKEFKFDNQGRITSMQLLSKGNRERSIEYETTSYLDDGLVVTKIYFNKSSEDYVVIEKMKHDSTLIKNNSSTPWFDLDFGNALKVEQGDVVKKINHYFKNGLLSTKERYLNNKLESTIIFEYVM